MRYTHTSQPSSQCSMYIICRIFWNILLINLKNTFRRTNQRINTKIATRPNTYDEEHNNVDTVPTAPQVPALPQNHPLSLIARNFRNFEITNNPNFRPSSMQSPIQHITTNHSQNDNTFEQIIEKPHTTTFQSQNNPFLAHDEQTSWIPPPLKFPRSQSPKSNPNYTTFRFPSPDFAIISIPSSTSSDTKSDISVFHTISQFNNSDLETPDEFANSEPSPSTYSQTNPSNFSEPPFQLINASQPLPSLSIPSHSSQVTPTYIPSLSDRSTNNSPDIPQISPELDNYITLQQQITHPHTLTIHHLSSVTTSSGPPTPTPLSD